MPEQIRNPLRALLDDANADLDKARDRVEKWFDDAMERVSGVYKRWTQISLLVIALVVAVTANVDTIQIAERLFSEPALRAAVADAARLYPDASHTVGDHDRPSGLQRLNIDHLDNDGA